MQVFISVEETMMKVWCNAYLPRHKNCSQRSPVCTIQFMHRAVFFFYTTCHNTTVQT